MGLAFRRPAFTEEQLQLYQDCTYFSRKEILRLYRRFCSLGAGEVDKTTGDISTRLSFILIQEMPEMRQNPFKVSSSCLFLSPSPLMSNLKMFGYEKRFFLAGATLRGVLNRRSRSKFRRFPGHVLRAQ